VPAGPSTESPEEIVICPLSFELRPVPNVTEPEPADVESGEANLIAPLSPWMLAPDDKLMKPPCPIEEEPPVTDTSPPAASLVPPSIKTELNFDEPPNREITPPELKFSFPNPALNLISPPTRESPLPAATTTLPPAGPVPEFKNKLPPMALDPAVDDPALTTTSPPKAPDVSPTVIEMDPLRR
jgi:hypothetical protein